MSSIDNNNQFSFKINLEPPGTGQDPKANVDTPRKGELTITDKLTGATVLLSASFDKLGKMTIYMDSENPSLPTPPITSAEIKIANAKGNPTGRENPYLAPIPFVQVTNKMLELFTIMRQSNLAMAKYENSCMSISMELAKTEADLILQSAQKDAGMAIMEAVGAAFAIAGACFSIGGAIKSFKGKGKMNDAKAELDKAKTDALPAQEAMNKAKTNLKTEQDNLKKFQDADLNVGNAETKQIAAHQKKMDAHRELGEAQLERKSTTEIDAKQKAKVTADDEFTVANKQLEDAKIDAAAAKKDLKLEDSAGNTPVDPESQMESRIRAKEADVAAAEKNLKGPEENIALKSKHYDAEQSAYSAQSQIDSMFFSAVEKIIASSGSIISSGGRAGLSLDKGKIEQNRTLTASEREMTNKIMDMLHSSESKGSDVMSSLIQAINKLADEHVNASNIRN